MRFFSKPSKYFLIASTAFALQGTVLAQQTPQKATAIRVLAEPVATRSDGFTFESFGTGWADKSANLYPVVEEKVTEVYFKAQDRVKKGALLVQLDDREEQLALRLAQVELGNAQSLLTRYEKAVLQGAVPETQVDDARAKVESAQVALEQAKLDLADRQIRAPFDGVVGIAGVDKGQRVGPDNMVTGLDSTESIYIDIDIPEKLLPYLNTGKPVVMQATSAAMPGQVFQARLSETQNRLNATSRTLRLRTRIDNRDGRIKPGISFQVRWEIPGTEYPSIPEIALQWSRDGAYLWAVRESKASKVFVSVIARQDGHVLVKGEIKPDELVIVEGVQRVRDKAPVTLIQAEAK